MNLKDKIWNPWHGCHKCSEGCQNCFVYELDKKYDRDTNLITKSKSSFNAPLQKINKVIISLKVEILSEYV